MKRSPIAVLIAIGLVALSPDITLAKFPPFTVELRPERPTAGQPVVVIVRTWEDAAHTIVADWGFPSPLEGLLALFPATGVDAGTGRVDVSLEETASGEWAATLPPLKPGTWIMRSFPDRATDEPMPVGYPDEVSFEVASAIAASASHVIVGGGVMGGRMVA